MRWLEALFPQVYSDQETSRWPNTIISRLDGMDDLPDLDPDAPVRELKKLHEDDTVLKYFGIQFLTVIKMKVEEDRFLEALWGFYRSGRAEFATEFCLRSGQAWRAASISGGSFYSMSFKCYLLEAKLHS